MKKTKIPVDGGFSIPLEFRVDVMKALRKVRFSRAAIMRRVRKRGIKP